MPDPTIVDAIENMNKLTFTYKNEERVAEPHAYGKSRKGNKIIRAYQTNGERKWRIFRTDAITGLRVSPDTFQTKRANYRKDDPEMVVIYRQL